MVTLLQIAAFITAVIVLAFACKWADDHAIRWIDNRIERHLRIRRRLGL